MVTPPGTLFSYIVVTPPGTFHFIVMDRLLKNNII